jgi:hypothetical protein
VEHATPCQQILHITNIDFSSDYVKLNTEGLFSVNNMKAIEFIGKVTTDGEIELPDTVVKQLPLDQNFRVIILINEAKEKAEQVAWSNLTKDHFLAGYSDKDAIYDKI